MTDDDLDTLFADAHVLANWPCSICGLVTSPYQLVEIRVLETSTRWLCWDCLHDLFGGQETTP